MADTMFHHIALVSRHLEDTVKFYQEGLGLEIWHVWGREHVDYIMALGNGSYVEIMAETHDAPLPRGQWARVSLKSADAAKSFEQALAAGAKPLETPHFVAADQAAPWPCPYLAAAVIGLEGEEIGFIQETGDDTPHEEKVHHVSLLVNDVERSAALFWRAFGLAVGPVVGTGTRRCPVDLGDGAYLELVEHRFAPPMPRGVWAHIALKAAEIHRVYGQAVAAGARPGAEPIFCDVTEATPYPVQFWAAAVHGCDGEDLTLLHDVRI
ncbi:MAG: VOC family protein [Oscillospiraceae bacterium]|jgi:glyoxylase I family protein|nr:VOC family protein [Oscillospiraceae bacterium]